jgi:hypothetical protein
MAISLKNKIASRRLGHSDSGPGNMELTTNTVYIVD